MKKIKIQKKTYRLDVRRKYQNVKHYKVKIKPPGEKIKEALLGLFVKKEPKKKSYARKKTISREKKPGFNFLLAGGAVGIGVILIFTVWVVLTIQSIPPAKPEILPILEKIKIENTIYEGDVLTAGDRYDNSYVSSVFMKYTADNLNSYEAEIKTYDKRVPSEVFVLRSERNSASNYAGFMRTLRSIFAEKNIVINEITIEELEKMPSGAVIIVPSGYIPKELLGSGTTLTPGALADKGAVVVYIGRPFTKMLDGESVVNTPASLLQNLPFSFDERISLAPSDDISLYDPLYAVNSIGLWSSNLEYGAVSILTRGDGAFIFVPQTLDGGWRENPLEPEKPAYKYAAEDVAKLILDVSWAEADSAGEYLFFSSEDPIERETGNIYLFSNPFKGTEKSVIIDFTGYRGVNGENITVEDRKVIHVSKDALGNIFIPEGYAVVSSSISGREVRIYGVLAEAQPAQPNMFLVVYDSSGSEVYRMSRGRVDTQGEETIDVPVNLPKGEYTMSLIDDSAYVYASSYLVVSSVEIKFTSELRSIYYFTLTMDGEPIPLTYIKVTIDGGDYGSYEFYDVEGKLQIDVAEKTGGGSLPPGDHTFSFEIGGLTEDVIVPVSAQIPPIFENPVFIGSIVLSIIIAVVGIFFSRKEQIYFSVDVPDFPPVARQKIPISSDVVMSIFEKVNSNYKWRFTPLRLSEVKTGFKDIYYKGKPIYITDYNAEYILDKLKSKGKLKSDLGYYAPAYWEGNSKKNISYLALMRKLRDICINNAIPFTALGDSKEADSEVDVMGQNMFIHFYDRSPDLSSLFERSLSTVSKGITIILFRDEFDKSKFRTLIDSPTVAQLLLKFEVQSSSILLLTTGELEQMIKELKTI